MISRSIHFHGPFNFFDGENSLFESEFSNETGIYLWVIKDAVKDLNYVHYIGETIRFAKRHREHITHILGLDYYVIDPVLARRGIHQIAWNGMWRDKSKNAAARTLRNYRDVSKIIIDYIKVIDIYFAQTDFPKDIRRHIEGCIGENFRNKDLEFTKFYPDDNRVGPRKLPINERLSITSDQAILGLDSEIVI